MPPMKNNEHRIQSLATIEMIQAGPGPLIMFVKDWVVRLTVVEMDTVYAMLKQTFLWTKHFLNGKQKSETLSDTCSKSEELPWSTAQSQPYPLYTGPSQGLEKESSP